MVDTDGLEYEDLINGETAPAQEDTTASFVVDSDIKAEWCIHKIAEVEAETERWKRFYAERTKAIEESNMFRIAHLKSLLVPYMNKVPLKDTKTQQKYTLPSGDLIIRKEHTKIEHDDAVLLDWLKSTPDGLEYVKYKESVDWKSLKASLVEKGGEYFLADTGEKVDGVHDVLVPAEFLVSPKGADTQ